MQKLAGGGREPGIQPSPGGTNALTFAVLSRATSSQLGVPPPCGAAARDHECDPLRAAGRGGFGELLPNDAGRGGLLCMHERSGDSASAVIRRQLVRSDRSYAGHSAGGGKQANSRTPSLEALLLYKQRVLTPATRRSSDAFSQKSDFGKRMGSAWPANKASFRSRGGAAGLRSESRLRLECRARSDRVIHAEIHREADILQ